jgi:endonuclease/exonuclease/phosphatase family metal-dependent hydrolase
MHSLTLFGAAALGLATAASHASPAPSLRIGTYNLALTEDVACGVIERLERGDDNARKLAAVIQRVRPDILLLNELDHDPDGRAAELFRARYLSQGQLGENAIDYPHLFTAPVNTGVDSGLDLDLDGKTGGPNDAWGFGKHPGQYGMVVLSKYPIQTGSARTFQYLLWSAMPDAVGPIAADSGQPWYPAETWAQLRLSSKSHWDLPVETPLGRIHLLISHPTPPAFDGPERRNAVRNFAELRFWKDYLDGGDWMVDDQGVGGGFDADARFVILGDLNADPGKGRSRPEAIGQLLDHPRMQSTPAPESAHAGTQTAHFGGELGHYRVDYVLPSQGFQVTDAGVFWPAPGTPGAEWIDASDHRLVWIQLGNGARVDEALAPASPP